MQTLEVRRHSFTKKGEGRGKGSHLSAEGVALAHAIGQQLAPFDRVFTSTIPRTLETALALGFAVDDQLAALSDISPEVLAEIGHHDRWSWPEPFVKFAQLVKQGGPTAQLGQGQRQVWAEALASAPESGRVLIISHGRVIEAGLVAALPNCDFSAWGQPFSHCEGIRLSYTAGEFRDVEFLRQSA
jgi:broad specificity phosphatase PhoE